MSLASMAFYRGLCPEDVAAASGLPTKTVDGILNGDVSLSSLSTGEQRALGHAFGLSLDGLLERAGTEGLRWVIYAYSPSELRETARRTRRLTPVTANFLRETLGLSRDEMAYYRVRPL